MTLPALPVFLRLAGRPVILVGTGEAADAKRRLLERAGAVVVGEPEAPSPPGRGLGEGRWNEQPFLEGRPLPQPPPQRGGGSARIAIVVDDDAAVARLKSRGILVNAVDRPELCDFTLPAIVDRAPVIVAIGTAGASAGLAAALRQRLEALLPANLGRLAEALHAARAAWRARYPDATDRRRAIAAALAPGGPLDPLGPIASDASPVDLPDTGGAASIRLRSADPDDLTLREARWLANADRVVHRADVPRAILDRARADAARIASPAPLRDIASAAPLREKAAGFTVDVDWA